VLWEIDAGDSGGELNVVRAGANYGWPVANGAARHPRVTSPALLLPEGTDPSGLTTVAATGSPFDGDLIVSALGAEDLLRVRIGEGGSMQLAGLLLQRSFGRIRQVASGPDGALFAITSNADAWGVGQDIAIRIAPVTSSSGIAPAAPITIRP
jgi:glucose/arabinose dehydrogenase